MKPYDQIHQQLMQNHTARPTTGGRFSLGVLLFVGAFLLGCSLGFAAFVLFDLARAFLQ